MKPKDIEVGQKYGHLLVMQHVCTDPKGRKYYKIQCDCGRTKDRMRADRILTSVSCGQKGCEFSDRGHSNLGKVNGLLKSGDFKSGENIDPPGNLGKMNSGENDIPQILDSSMITDSSKSGDFKSGDFKSGDFKSGDFKSGENDIPVSEQTITLFSSLLTQGYSLPSLALVYQTLQELGAIGTYNTLSHEEQRRFIDELLGKV